MAILCILNLAQMRITNMNVGLVFFAYKNDEPLLRLALEAVPRLRAAGDNVEVFVFDDASAPLSAPPRGVKYQQTHFDRGGNLNGLQCIQGMLEAYARVMAYGRFSWLIKADCDTFVNNIEWLRDLDAKSTAFAGTIHVNDHASGACYALSREGVAVLQERMLCPSWQGKASRGYCEDRVFYHMSRLSGLDIAAFRNDANALDGPLFHAWLAARRYEPAELLKAYAVDFKACRWNSRPEDWEQDAATALERMTEYCNFIKQNHG